MANSPKKKDPWWWKAFFATPERTLFTLGVSIFLIATGLWHIVVIGALVVIGAMVIPGLLQKMR